MTHLTRLLLLATASFLWVGAASADTIVTSDSSRIAYTSGPIAFSGSTANNTPGAFSGSAATYNIGTGGIWMDPLANSSWVSFDRYTAPGDLHAQGNPNPNVPNSTPSTPYVYKVTSPLGLTAGQLYTVNFQVLADDTTGVFLDGVEVINPGSGQADHCVNVGTGPTCTMVYNAPSYSFIANGSDTLVFDVYQMFGIATGLDFSVDFTPVVPTPEPNSLMLLGTGLIGAAGALRRRLRA